MLKIDFSKAMAMHRLYGHYVFAIEAHKAKKDVRFIRTICFNLKCDGRPTHWLDDLLNQI